MGFEKFKFYRENFNYFYELVKKDYEQIIEKVSDK